MTHFARRSPMPVSAEELFAWHARPGALARLTPPWERVRVKAIEGPFGDGQRVTLNAAVAGPVRMDWVVEHFGTEPGHQFRDRQLSGPFAHWVHTHRMIADGPDASVLEDAIEYRVPLGTLGRAVGGGMVGGKLDAMFAYRHVLTASDLRRHKQFAQKPRLTVGITGSTGMVGGQLVPFLTAGGHAVVRLQRGEPRTEPGDGTTVRKWHPDGPPDPAMLDGLDAVIHLAGDNLADGRWTAAKKARIRDSRVGPTARLAEAVAAAKVPVFLSASAVGIYGDRGDEVLTEQSHPGTGFLADVAKGWEGATAAASAGGTRVVNLRIGVVQWPQGGALGKQLPAFKLGQGAVLGTGKQWVSWVTLNDLIGGIHHALMTDSLSGPIDLTAPNPVTNRDYGRQLARVLGRPYLLTVPAPVLRLLFGEMADAALLSSTRVEPRALQESGFTFDDPELAPALTKLLGKTTL
jgi:uncharacterized protein (TIGR01777 family)